jgi:hypothetical protein
VRKEADMPTIDSATLERWRTLAVVDRAGGTVGNIVEFYLDRGTGQPTWALVNTAMFGDRQTFVPLLHATEVDDGLQVPYEKDHIKDAPRIEAAGELTPEHEATLFAHYGIEYRPADEPTPEDPGLADPRDASIQTSTEPSAGSGAWTEPGAETAAGSGVEAPAERGTGAAASDFRGPVEPDAEVPAGRRGEASSASAVGAPAEPASEPPMAPAPLPAGRFAEPAVDARDRDEARAADARPDDATASDEPSVLERAKRRLEGLVSGGGHETPADRNRDVADADRSDPDHPVDRDRR